jgi:GT2 family glycosyltransferase
MFTNTRISVIIPTIEEGKFQVLRLIKAALKLFGNYEIVVVRNVRPAGKARNVGAAKASGDVLLFVDDDVIFDPRSFVEVVDRVLSNERTVAGPCVKNVFFKFTYVSTGLMGLKKSDFIEIGGFDEQLYGYEDLEFSVRAVRKGYRIIGCSLSMEHHNPRRFIAFLLRSLRYEWCGTLMAIKHAQYFRLNNLRWFFPLFINTSKMPSLYKGMSYTFFRNPAMRILVRIISFYYWTLQKLIGFLRKHIKLHA